MGKSNRDKEVWPYVWSVMNLAKDENKDCWVSDFWARHWEKTQKEMDVSAGELICLASESVEETV